MVLFIENHDILFGKNRSTQQPVWKVYRRFLYSVLVYYISDALWGFIEHQKNVALLYADTMFYFIAMASGILFWTKFVVEYLKQGSRFGRLLILVGRVFFVFCIATVVLNPMKPLLFTVDAQCVYEAGPLRHVLLIWQIVLFVLISLYAFWALAHEASTARKRFRTIAAFGLIVATFLMIQLWNAYLPLYTVAYLLGTSLLHTFVINDEKEEYKAELEQAVKREKQQYEELIAARSLAYQDALTGVKSKLSFLEYETQKDQDICADRRPEFAIAVFDINGLKEVNDTQGHEQGDALIKAACKIICGHFQHSPVFRIGGDEFAALLIGNDYRNRAALTDSFSEMTEQSEQSIRVVIAMGITDFDAEQDHSFHDVFVRADKQMYERKRLLKTQGKTSCILANDVL